VLGNAVIKLQLIEVANGNSKPVEIIISEPVWNITNSESHCKVLISTLNLEHEVVGADPLDALSNALLFARGFIDKRKGIQWKTV
jgi:hypothetical protein